MGLEKVLPLQTTNFVFNKHASLGLYLLITNLYIKRQFIGENADKNSKVFLLTVTTYNCFNTVFM